MNKIVYIADFSLPSTSAYSIHAFKMCDSLNKKKLKTKLILPYVKSKKLNFQKYYMLENKLKIVSIFKKKVDINFFSRILFSYKILNHVKDSLIISRSPLPSLILSVFGYKNILELHHELKGMTNFLFVVSNFFNLTKNIKFIFIHKNLKKKFKYIRKYLVLDDAVNINHFKIKNKKKIKHKNTCVYMGSLHEGKGVEIIEKISQLNSKINFHLYGDLNFLQKKKYPKNMKFFHHIPYYKVPEILQNYIIALMPYGRKVHGRSDSLSLEKNMSPMKMFDYLASSKVIIASKLPVYNHILKSGYNSILVAPENINGWIKNIENVFLNEKLRDKIKINAYQTAKNFTWDIRVDKIIEWY